MAHNEKQPPEIGTILEENLNGAPAVVGVVTNNF
jgi:hypothetical protein